MITLSIVISTGALAATLPFDIEKPDLKFVKSDKGVNIRQKPSTSAPRAIYDVGEADLAMDFGGDIIDVAFWSSAAPTRNRKPMEFYGPGIVAREENGWYEIKGLAPQNKGNGWVSAKFCTPYIPPKITYPNTPSEGTYWKWITGVPGIEDGQYAICYEFYGDACPALIYVGKMLDGVLVCPFRFGSPEHPVMIHYDDDLAQGALLPPEKSQMFNEWELVLGKAQMSKGSSGWETMNFSLINNDMMQEIIERAQPLAKPVIITINQYGDLQSF